MALQGAVVPTDRETSTWAGVDPGTVSSSNKQATLKRYRDRITASKQWRDSEGFDNTWKRLRDIYRLKMFQGPSDDDRIAVAIAFATINVIAPSVAVNHPKIVVWAKDELPESQDKATIVEAVVNYWWRHYDVKPAFRRIVQDFLVYGHGWAKVGYRYEEHEEETAPEEQQAYIDEANAQLDQFAQDNPQHALDLPSEADVRAAAPQSQTHVDADEPFVERVSPLDIFVDPEATGMQDIQWIAQRVVRPLEEVQKDQSYKQGARRKVKADGSLKWINEDNRQGPPADSGRVTLWEFYDITNGTMSVFTDQGSVGYLIEPQPMPYPYGHPFVMLRNYEVPDQFYPIGEIEAIEPLQNELNHTRSGMVQVRQTDKRKWMYNKDAFDPQGIDALTSADDGALVPVKGDIPFDRAIAPLPRNEGQAQFYAQHSDVIESDIDRVTGVNEYMRGALPEVRRTATEASIIQDAANARAADKLDRIESFIAEIASRLVALAQEFMTTEQVARIVGPTAQAVWVPFSREDIEGEYDFEVEAGSTQPKNETFRRQQAVQMMQTLTPFIGTVIDPVAMAQHVLREGFGIKNPDRFMMQQMPMMSAGQPPMGPDGQPMPPEEGGETTPDAESAQEDQGFSAAPQLQGQVGLDVGPMQ